MTPGTYLKLRREAAHVPLGILVIQLTGMPDRIRPVTDEDRMRMLRHLVAAEADQVIVTVPQAALIRRAVPFDITVYEKLLQRHVEGPFSAAPEPRVCTGCGCSWHDACVTHAGPCRWASAEADHCSACVDVVERAYHSVFEGIAA
jgi:hypothetical protein